MRVFSVFLLMFITVLYYQCSQSTQSDGSNGSDLVIMKTDSLQYVSHVLPVILKVQITNSSDSTLIFPACGIISTRIDNKNGDDWYLDSARWYYPCLAIFSHSEKIESDSSYMLQVVIDSAGTYRIATYYHVLGDSGVNENKADTLFSNVFKVF